MSPSPHSRRSALRGRHRIPHFRAYVRANHQDHTGRRQLPRRHAPSRGVNGRSPRLGVAPRPRRAACLSGQNEEGLLIRLCVVDAALAGLEDGHIDPEMRELDRRLAVLVGEPTRAPRLRREPLGVAHVDDKPTLRDGGKPEPASSSLASFTQRILAVQATAVSSGRASSRNQRRSALTLHAQRAVATAVPTSVPHRGCAEAAKLRECRQSPSGFESRSGIERRCGS